MFLTLNSDIQTNVVCYFASSYLTCRELVLPEHTAILCKHLTSWDWFVPNWKGWVQPTPRPCLVHPCLLHCVIGRFGLKEAQILMGICRSAAFKCIYYLSLYFYLLFRVKVFFSNSIFIIDNRREDELEKSRGDEEPSEMTEQEGRFEAG